MSSKDKLIAKIESSKIRKDVTLEELTSYLGFLGLNAHEHEEVIDNFFTEIAVRY